MPLIFFSFKLWGLLGEFYFNWIESTVLKLQLHIMMKFTGDKPALVAIAVMKYSSSSKEDYNWVSPNYKAQLKRQFPISSIFFFWGHTVSIQYDVIILQNIYNHITLILFQYNTLYSNCNIVINELLITSVAIFSREISLYLYTPNFTILHMEYIILT